MQKYTMQEKNETTDVIFSNRPDFSYIDRVAPIGYRPGNPGRKYV